MPSWLSNVNPVAVGFGLIFIGVAVADHFINGPKNSWTDLDVSFMWAGGAVGGVGAVTHSVNTIANSVGNAIAQGLTKTP